MKLLNSSLGEVGISRVEIIDFAESISVYNLTVEGNHNYFAQNILVHNADPAEYNKFEVVLEGSISRVLDSPVDSERRYEEMNKLAATYGDLIAFTQNDRAFIADKGLRNEVLSNLTRSKELLDFYISKERASSGYSYKETNQILLELKNKVLKENTQYILLRENKLIDRISRTKGIREILSVKDSIKSSSQKVKSPYNKEVIVKPSWVAAILLDERMRYDELDKSQDEDLRKYMNSSKLIPSNADDTSYGPAQMNLSVAIELFDNGYLDKPVGWKNDIEVKRKFAASYLLDKQKAPELVAARIQQIYEWWIYPNSRGNLYNSKSQSIDLSDQPEIFGTLYSQGLFSLKSGNIGYRKPISDPDRGESIARYSRMFDRILK